MQISTDAQIQENLLRHIMCNYLSKTFFSNLCKLTCSSATGVLSGGGEGPGRLAWVGAAAVAAWCPLCRRVGKSRPQLSRPACGVEHQTSCSASVKDPIALYLAKCTNCHHNVAWKATPCFHLMSKKVSVMTSSGQPNEVAALQKSQCCSIRPWKYQLKLI